MGSEPHPLAFVEAEVGLGIAASGFGACVDNCSPGRADGLIAFAHGGAGAGLFFGSTLALVVRMHAIYGITGNPPVVGFFYGVGAQLRVVPRSEPRDYWFLEVVPGREALGRPEAGNTDGFSIAVRAGVNLSPATLALTTTIMVDPSYATYSQQDLTFVVGLHGNWLEE